MFKQLFIYRLFKESKWLFAIFIFLCIGQKWAYNKKVNSIPFFYWAMYSSVENVPDYVNQFIIKIDGVPFNYLSLDYWGGIGVSKSLIMYKTIIDNSMQDPMYDLVQKRLKAFPKPFQYFSEYKLLNHDFEVKKYPVWLHQYLEKKLNRKIHRIEVYNNWYAYKDKGFEFSGGGDIFLSYPSRTNE